MKWTELRVLGSNKIVKSSYYWLVLVPVAAKLLNSINDTLRFRIFGADISITFGLPFSWKVLFFAALFFSIANVLYQVFCPKLIQLFKNTAEFDSSKISELQLYKIGVEFILTWRKNKFGLKKEINENQIKNYIWYNHLNTYTYQQHNSQTNLLNETIKKQQKYNKEDIDPETIDLSIDMGTAVRDKIETYENIIELQDIAYRKIRIVTSVFYIIGLALSCIIVVQNIYHVARFL